MTIQEMHIAVNLGVQKIASFQVDNMLPQEIDHELNNAMERFIKLRYSTYGNKYQRGFEQSQKRIDDLRNLVVNSRIEAYYNRESIGNGEFFVERARLPEDYLFLVNLLSNIQFDCSGSSEVITNGVSKTYFTVSLNPPSPGTVLKSILYYDPTNPSNIGGAFISSETGMSSDYYSSAANYSSITGVVPAVSAQSPDMGIDYELTPTVDSNTLLLNIPSTYYIQNGWIAVWINPLTLEETNVVYPFNPIYTNLIRRQLIPSATKRVACKYVQHDDILALLDDPFNTTKHTSPKYTIQENFIDVYSNNEFIPIFVELTYIRHPKKMNYLLGIGCELAEHTHQEIVEMSIQSILEAFESPRYTTQSREVLESE
jgi:hypothetical protein